jgi:hypothetical protein
MPYSKTLFRHFVGETEEIHEKPLRVHGVSWIRIEYIRIEVGSVTASASYLGSPILIWVTSCNSMVHN